MGTGAVEQPVDGGNVRTPEAPSEPAALSVFVDDTGRRRRWGRRIGHVAGACFLSYFVLLVASLARAPWVPQVTLPGVGSLLAPEDPVLPHLGPDAVTTPLPEIRSEASPASPSSHPTVRSPAPRPAPTAPTHRTPTATGGGPLESTPASAAPAGPTTTAPTTEAFPPTTTSTTAAKPAKPDPTTTTATTTTPPTTADPGRGQGPPDGTAAGQGPLGGIPPGQERKATRGSGESTTTTTTTTSSSHGRR